MKNYKLISILILCFFIFTSETNFSAENKPQKMSLEQCLIIALKNNFDLQIEQEMIQNEDMKLRQVKAQRLPQLSFEGNYLRFSEVMEATIAPDLTGLPIQMKPIYMRFGDEDNYSAKVSITQPIFTGFKLKNTIQAAENQFNAAQYSEKKMLNNLCFDVKKNFYNLLNAQQVKQVALLSLRSVNAHLKDVENLYQQGMINQTEVLKVQIKKSEIDLMINQADNRIQLLKKSLLNLLGLDLDTELLLEADSMSITEINNISKDGIQNRPELIELDFKKKALQHLLNVSKSNYYPSLSLIGNYEYGKPGLNKLENEWMDYWTVGIAAQWPIWDWGIRKYQNQQAKVALNQTDLIRQKLKKAIQLDIQKAELSKNEAVQRITLAQQARSLAEENFKLIQNQFKQGLVTNTDFLDAETQLTKSKIEEWQARADYQIAIADYERAMGVWNFPSEN